MQAWGLEWQKEKCGERRGSRGRGGSRGEAANPEWESALENGKRGKAWRGK